MSWTAYLTNLKTEGLKHVAICGADNASWIEASDGSNITQAELQSLLGNFGNVGTLAQSGIRVGGEKYMYISGTDQVCRGKKGTSGVHAAKSKTTLVLGIYDESMQPGQAASAVEKMAEYLTTQNY